MDDVKRVTSWNRQFLSHNEVTKTIVFQAFKPLKCLFPENWLHTCSFAYPHDPRVVLILPAMYCLISANYCESVEPFQHRTVTHGARNGLFVFRVCLLSWFVLMTPAL